MSSTCLNYGSLSAASGTCDCPSGLGGSNCNSLLCGNPIATAGNRTALSSSATSTGCTGTSQCTSGFNGLDCAICTSNDACSSAIASFGSRNSSSSDISAGQALIPDTMTCSASPFTYTSSYIECDVVNPTLQGVFPGITTLKFQKNVRPSLSVSSTFGGENTTFAQLWYSATESTAPAEQFYCSANSCVQGNSTTTNQITWSCQNLECTCVSGSTFCDGPLALASTLNGLAGTLDIDCAAGGGDCSFKQATLQSLFGANGLGLSGCRFGECVSSRVVTQFSGDGTADASNDSLSGGVIAGLAVVGALLLAVAGLFLLGFLSQKKARQGGRKHLDDVQPAGLSWSEISYYLPLGRGRLLARLGRSSRAGITESETARHLVAYEKDAVLSSRRSDGSQGKRIVDGISGSIPYGGLVAILGPSGAGKSTLVDILAGKRKVGQVSGNVQLLTENPGAVRIGYVDQADVLSANLTVRETLMFAAKLKLPESIGESEKAERVWEVLGQLGLQDIAESRVGSGERRGISGGERRRLSIGLELIARPSILILDEPTSGLDSVSAAKVVQVLRDLAHGDHGVVQKTTIIATIHQPSSQIFHAFDTVLLLSLRGTQVYYGSARSATAHFGQLGYPCPKDWNPADHLLEMATTEAVISSRGTSSPQKESMTSENRTHDLTSVNSKGSGHDGAYPPPMGGAASATAVKLRNARPIATRLTQFQVLSHREYLNLKRDWSLVVMHNVIACIVGVFVGGLYFKVDITISGFQNRIGSLFFLGALIAFSALSALSNLLVVRSLFLRERSSSYYSSIIWMLSRVVWDIVPLRIAPTILLGTITYWMVGLSKDAAHFFKFLLILVEYSALITLWNLLLAVVIPQSAVAILVSNVLNLAQLAYAGFFVNLGKIPAVLRWIQWLNPLKYALEALAVNEVSGGLLIQDTLQGVPVQINAVLIMELLFGFKLDAYYRDVLVLFGWMALFGLCLIFSIWRLREIR